MIALLPIWNLKIIGNPALAPLFSAFRFLQGRAGIGTCRPPTRDQAERNVDFTDGAAKVNSVPLARHYHRRVISS
jgi:hypothetical protein